MPNYGVLSLSQLLWACVTMGFQDQKFLLAAQEAAIRQIDKLEMQVGCLAFGMFAVAVSAALHGCMATRMMCSSQHHVSPTRGSHSCRRWSCRVFVYLNPRRMQCA